jgi:O-antigen/teichoic acid export membrane protein
VSRSAGKSMAWGGALSGARLISGLVRIKIVALALGVGGVGIFSLLLQLNLTGVALVSMSLAVPIINLGRPTVANGKFAAAGAIVGTALAMVAVNVLLLILVAAVFGADVFRAVGIGQLNPLLVWPVTLSILIAAFGTSIGEGMSYLSDRFDAYVRAGIAAAVADMLATATGAWLYGLHGAVFAMPVSSIVLVGAYALLLGRDRTVRQVLRNLSVKLRQLSGLLTYSAMMFVTIAVTNIGLTFTRAKLVVDAGAQANGYLQTATAISAYILAFVTTGFWGHLHARAAAAGDSPEIRTELARALRLGLLISFTGCGAAAVLAPYLIPLFYSGQFSSGGKLMIAYMPGELCYQLLFLLTAYQLTVSRRRRYLYWSAGYVLLLTAIGYLTIPRFGALGYVGAHISAALLMLVAAAAVCWRTGQVQAPLLLLAIVLLGVLTLMSAGSFYLLAHSEAEPWRVLGLVPVVATAAIAGQELLGGVRWRRMSG